MYPPIKRGIIAALSLVAAVVPVTAGEPGRVYYQRLAAPDLDRWTNSPDPGVQRWFRDHFFRMAVFSPYFDSRLKWYPAAIFYRDLYGIPPDSAVYKEHPDWALHDPSGHPLYIPWNCAAGSCPQFAADVANPAFRAWWIREAQTTMSRGYRGIWLDDVNMEFRVSDGTGKPVPPIDKATGRPMTWDAWRDYVASFVEQIRNSFPKAEIVQNAIWFAGPEGIRDADPAIRRQISTADNINLERGIASDPNLTGGKGNWSLYALLAYIDRVHAAGRGVTFGEFTLDRAALEYAVAGYFLISNGADRIGDAATNPENWWSGFEVNLGIPISARTYKDGVYSKTFSRGMVLLGEPGLGARTVNLPRTFTTLNGEVVSSVTLKGREGIILQNKD
jgi:hypothetical protein